MALIYSSAVNKRINLRNKRSNTDSNHRSMCRSYYQQHHNDELTRSSDDDLNILNNRNSDTALNEKCRQSLEKCGSCDHDSEACKCASTSKHSNATKRSNSKVSTHSKITTRNSKLSTTSCGDARRKATIAGTPSNYAVSKNERKISTPVMSNSMYVDNRHTELTMRKAIAKKHLNRKIAHENETEDHANEERNDSIGTDSSCASDSPTREEALLRCRNFHNNFYNRRRSVSLDAVEGSTNCGSMQHSTSDVSHDHSDSPTERSSKINPLQRIKDRFNKWKISA